MKTETHRFDDGDSPFDEKLAEETVDLMNRLERQFKRLQTKAVEIGVCSVVVLHAHDPLTGYSFRRCTRRGDHYANYGAMQISTDQLRQELTPED